MTILCIFSFRKEFRNIDLQFFESFLPFYSDQSLCFTTVKPHLLPVYPIQKTNPITSPDKRYHHFEACITT
jgi:hypothetical protein